jgi:hypothetical protein
MILAEEFIKLSREERTSHLDLDSPCDMRGGESKHFKGLLAHHLNTTIPKGFIYLCHACHNGGCSNVKHLYWGTPKDNRRDFMTTENYVPFPEVLVRKFGEEKVREMARVNGAKRKNMEL